MAVLSRRKFLHLSGVGITGIAAYHGNIRKPLSKQVLV